MLSNVNNCVELTRAELDLVILANIQAVAKIELRSFRLPSVRLHLKSIGCVFTSLWFKLFAVPQIKRNRLPE